MVAVATTHVVGVVASLSVALALLVAGVSKLSSPWRRDAEAMGVPWAVAAPVPVVEIVLGGLLAAGLGRPVVAWSAAALLTAFTALVATNLARGHRPPCACFGAWSRTPLGPRHLVRNGLLVAAAVLATLA